MEKMEKTEKTEKTEKKVTCYMDRTDFYYELDDAAGGNTIYGSVEDTLKHCSCAKSCGVVEVEVTYVKDVVDGDDSGSILSTDIENKTPYYIEQEKKGIIHWRQQAEFYKLRSERYLALAANREKKLEEK